MQRQHACPVSHLPISHTTVSRHIALRRAMAHVQVSRRSIAAQAHAHTLTSVCACALRNSASREHGAIASAPHLDCEEIQTYYCIQLYHRDLNDMSCSAMRSLHVHYVAGTLTGYACAAAPPPDEDRRGPTERNYSPDVTNLADIKLEPDANLWRMHRLILRSTQQRSYASC